MDKYYDRNGLEISVGDILVYDEGEGLTQTIDEVVEHNGQLAGVVRVAVGPGYTGLSEPVPLKYYKLSPDSGENVTKDARIIRERPEVAFTHEFVRQIFG